MILFSLRLFFGIDIRSFFNFIFIFLLLHILLARGLKAFSLAGASSFPQLSSMLSTKVNIAFMATIRRKKVKILRKDVSEYLKGKKCK